MKRFLGIATATIGVGLIAGCSSAPRQTPIPGAAIGTGEGSLQAVRRQFSGTWDLVSYSVYDEDGRAVGIPATGQATADEFGNVEFMGEATRSTDTGPALAALNSSGRLVIDIALQRFLIMRLQEDEVTAEVFASSPPESFRYYEFVDNEVHIDVRDDDGNTTASTIYRRRQ